MTKIQHLTLDALPWPDVGHPMRLQLEGDLICYSLASADAPESKLVADSLFEYEDGSLQEGVQIIVEAGTTVSLISFTEFGFLRVHRYNGTLDVWDVVKTYKY